jgi:hypothetical protein
MDGCKWWTGNNVEGRGRNIILRYWATTLGKIMFIRLIPIINANVKAW